jgi:pimeloyl-ACP methyl ester carboxylesterase
VYVVEDRSASAHADTIVLLHAGASSGDQWRGVQRELGKKYNLVVPDLYGDGRSTASLPHVEGELLAAEIELVHSVAQRAGGRAHLVGHSYGGLVALRTALAHPEIVQSLVVFEPITFDLVRREADAKVFRELDEVRRGCDEAVSAGDLERAARRFVDYWDEEGTYLGLPSSTQALVAAAMPKVTRSWHAIVEGPADYARLAVRTTVIEGSLSPAPARSMAKRISETIRGARLVHLEGVGHLAPVTHPAVVAREICQHLWLLP